MTNLGANDYSVCVGVITASSGVRGNVKICYFTQDPYDLEGFKKIYDRGLNVYKIKILNLCKDYCIASIEGIDNRNAADKLRNAKIFIDRNELIDTKDNEYYHIDLIGMGVFDTYGVYLGKIFNIVNFGASDIMEVEEVITSNTVYYPFCKDNIISVDSAKRCIVINIPEEVIAAEE